MKKIITASVALLSVITLAACSGKTASESSGKASSSVEKNLLQRINQVALKLHQKRLVQMQNCQKLFS